MGNGLNAVIEAIKNGTVTSLEALQKLSGLEGRWLAIINGIIGDTLKEKGSRLALDMELLGEVRGKKLCILVHGLCDSETNWNYPNQAGKTYGSLLEKDLGYVPLYLRYNSGLHISTNGQAFSKLLTKTLRTKLDAIQEIVLIGHSMGGLVVRSACHYGKMHRARWVDRVKKIFLLGTPHHGTDLEKIGNLTGAVLNMIPHPVTKGIAGLGSQRSAGIKDLRFGYLLDEDWQGHEADVVFKDNRHHVPLLEGVDYYIITASLAKETDNAIFQYFGDGLVPRRSAMGKSLLKSKTLPFLPEHLKTIPRISHPGLTHHDKVYRQIREWCQ